MGVCKKELGLFKDITFTVNFLMELTNTMKIVMTLGNLIEIWILWNGDKS
jgi:hypothetical protein